MNQPVPPCPYNRVESLPKRVAGREWRLLTAAVKARDNLTCQYCRRTSTSNDKDPDGRTWHIDHYIPRSRGGQTLLANLRLACAGCNNRKGESLPDHPWRERSEQEQARLAKVAEESARRRAEYEASRPNLEPVRNLSPFDELVVLAAIAHVKAYDEVPTTESIARSIGVPEFVVSGQWRVEPVAEVPL